MPTLVENPFSTLVSQDSILAFLPLQDNEALGQWSKQEIEDCFQNKIVLIQPLKKALANTFPCLQLYQLIDQPMIPTFKENGTRLQGMEDHFYLEFGCTNALKQIKNKEYEIRAPKDANLFPTYIDWIKDFYNSMFKLEHDPLNNMVKTQPDKMMHLIVTRISYIKARTKIIKKHKIVAAATFYINNDNNAAFLVYVAVDPNNISMESHDHSPANPEMKLYRSSIGSFLNATIQKIIFLRTDKYEICLQANHKETGPKLFYQQLLYDPITEKHPTVLKFRKEINKILSDHVTLFWY